MDKRDHPAIVFLWGVILLAAVALFLFALLSGNQDLSVTGGLFLLAMPGAWSLK